MAAKSKRATQSAKKAGEAASSLRSNPYVQRLIEDEELRDNIREAVEAARDAYARIANGKGPAKAIMEDKKVHKDMRKAAESLRDASEALRGKRKKSPLGQDHPDRPHRRGHRAAAQRGHPQGAARQALRGRGGVRVLLDDLAHAGDAGGHEDLELGPSEICEKPPEPRRLFAGWGGRIAPRAVQQLLRVVLAIRA